MRIVGKLTTAIAIGFLVLGCNAANNLESFRAFGASDLSGAPDFRTPFTAPVIVVRHSMGLSRVYLYAEKGAVNQYIEGGSGEALPVSVYVRPPTDMSGSNLKIHRSLALSGGYQFSGVFTDMENRNVALALAKEVLARSYCSGGAVTENYDAQFVDDTGPRPVARDRPMITAIPPNNERKTPGWSVMLRCGLWSKP